MKKYILSILSAALLATTVQAQTAPAALTCSDRMNFTNPFKSNDAYTGWSAIVKLGITQPYTDINMYQYYKVWSHKNENQPMLTVGAQKMVSNVIGFQGLLSYGTLQGTLRPLSTNANTEQKLYFQSLGSVGTAAAKSGVYFRTNILALNANLYFNWSNLGYSLLSANKSVYDRKYTFYSTLGFGMTAFNSTIYSSKTGEALASNKYMSGITNKDGKTYETNIPMSTGFKYKVNNKISVGAEYTLNNVLSDKLDAYVNAAPVNGSTTGTGLWLRNGAYDKFGVFAVTMNYNILGSNAKAQNIEWTNPYDNKIINEKLISQADLAADADADGVSDLLDKEPNTPAGCRVDGTGRAMDTDGDGVVDCRDRERLSPAGYPVDQYGVAQIPDSDGDGIADNLDWEVHSAVGCKVDQHGVCPPPPAPAVVAPITFESIYFKTNNNVIDKEYMPTIQHIAMTLLANPKMNVTIAGNTDKHHSDDYNDKLGMRRAKAVADILIKRFGISSDRINIKSNGKRSIRFQNSDELNRRVDISIQ